MTTVLNKDKLSQLPKAKAFGLVKARLIRLSRSIYNWVGYVKNI